MSDPVDSATSPAAPDGSEIGRKMAKGAAWMVGVQVTNRLLGIVSMLVLARLLTPADFGLVAMATVVIGIMEIWSYFGFDFALIRDQQATQDHYDTAWTLNAMRGLAMAVIIFASAGLAARFFNDDRVVVIMQLLSLLSLMEGLQSIRIVDFRKDLSLHKEFQFSMGARLSQVLVTMTFAFMWRDYWALVTGILCGAVIKLGLSYVMAPHRPRFSLAEFSDLFGFSKWIMVNSILNFLSTRLDTFAIGRFIGAESVGAYQMGYEISNMPTTELVWPISRAVYPGFAKLSASSDALEESYNMSLGLIVLIALPLAAGIGFTADYFVPILLGQKWLETIPLIQVLSLYGIMRIMVGNSGSLYAAINRPKLICLFGSFNLAVQVPLLIWWTTKFGAIGAAWSIVVSCIPMVILMFWINTRLVGLSTWKTVSVLYRPIVGVSVMGAALLALRHVLPPGDDFARLTGILAILTVTGAVVYLSAVLALRRLFPHGHDVEGLVLRYLNRKRRNSTA